ncbi:MAG: alpha/beta hydrolase, partial [Candidatus Nanopelagicales bacterium]
FPDWSEADLASEIPDPGDRALLLAGLRPRSLDFFDEPLPMPEDWPDARCAYLQLSQAYAVPAATAASRGWTVRSESLHHFAALTHPDAVANALDSLLITL